MNIRVRHALRTGESVMAHYPDEEDPPLDLQNNQEEYQMEEHLVEALGYDSVNWELIKALKSFTQSLVLTAKLPEQDAPEE
ncbi:hypothetical protein NDU88_000990 [Pleurodeles waltl]|uniref:Uncharacterized protein n=1 Tax=Pleurodeles waltl TaxID=8319 RepID=A0AAV7VZ54_PLEWA|nr:hypothetical protein NDU88_000990 [Pleurodeles waltl]